MSDKSYEFFGDFGLGAKVMEKDARILSTLEVYAKVEKFQKISGLRSTQFALNSWGYPFMPIPDVKKAYGNIRLAPKNVSPAFLGHPIYWIDPELTSKKENESNQEWCIRMFYLIDAFGYFDEHARWIDFLEINDFQYTEAQIKTYHKIADNSVTDGYHMLDEADFDTSAESAQEEYDKALLRCAEIQKKESVKMLKTQADEYGFALSVLGDDIYDSDASYSSPGGTWNERIYPRLTSIAEKYSQRSREGDTVVSDLLRETRNIYDVVIPLVERFNRSASILELPVKAIAEGNPGGAARISWMATAMSISMSKENLRKVAFDKIDDAIREAFSNGNQGEHGFDIVIETMAEVYSTAWNRLRLHFINYRRVQHGEEPFATVVELNVRLNKQGVMNQQYDSMLDFEESLR